MTRFTNPAALVVAGILFAVAWYLAIGGVWAQHRIAPDRVLPWHGAAYVTFIPNDHSLPLLRTRYVRDAEPAPADLALQEAGQNLGPVQQANWDIARAGRGMLALRGQRLIFSASDGTDPRGNGRSYVLHTRQFLPVPWALLATFLAIVLALGVRHAARAGVVPISPGVNANPATGTLARALALFLSAYVVRQAIDMAPGWVRGALLWCAIGLLGVLMVLGLRELVLWLGSQWARAWRGAAAVNLALAIATVAISAAGLELALALAGDMLLKPAGANSGMRAPDVNVNAPPVRVGQAEITLPPEIMARIARNRDLAILPAEWVLGAVSVAGATRAYVWHGVLHVFDTHGFRRVNGPFPPRDPGRLRILALGDSFTYGQGVAAEWAWPAQLQRLLAQDHAVEVINLGMTGVQGEDLAMALLAMLPELRPDLVLYGMYLNDFLPSVNEAPAAQGFPNPLEWLTQPLVQRTQLGRLAADAWQQLVIRIGLAPDILDDILRDLPRNRVRFAHDMAVMRDTMAQAGLPPIIAMVLDQTPVRGGRGEQLARQAEDVMREAGFSVISNAMMYARHDGAWLQVSRWEAHPNEEAHAIYAAHFANELLNRPEFRARQGLRVPAADR